MFQLNNGNQFLMAFLITIGLLANVSGQIQKCAAVGEYCQSHWECCSNSCMSYLYKCVRNYNIYPYTFLSYEPPRRTVEEILELNFGVNNYFRPNAVPQPIGVYGQLLGANEIVPNNHVLELVEYESPIIRPITADTAAATLTIATGTATPAFETVPRLGTVNEIVPITTATETSLSTTQSPSLSSTTTPTPTTTTTTTTTTPTPATPTTPTPTTTTTKTTEPAATATASTITSSSTTTAPPAKCSVIGVKCFRNEECCTQRCHGFLHQCVT